MWVPEASLTKLPYKIFHVFSYIQELPGGKKENNSVPVLVQIVLKYDHSFKTVVFFLYSLLLYVFTLLIYFFVSHFWSNLHKFSMVKASLIVQLVKNPPARQEILVGFLGWEDPLDKGTATHPVFSMVKRSFLLRKIRW